VFRQLEVWQVNSRSPFLIMSYSLSSRDDFIKYSYIGLIWGKLTQSLWLKSDLSIHEGLTLLLQAYARHAPAHPTFSLSASPRLGISPAQSRLQPFHSSYQRHYLFVCPWYDSGWFLVAPILQLTPLVYSPNESGAN